MVQFSDKLLEGLRDPIEDFVADLKEEEEGEIPEREVYIPDEDGGFNQVAVPQFNKLIWEYMEENQGALTDAAEWMVESDAINNEDYIHDKDNLAESYSFQISSLISDILNYAEGYNFSDSHYEKAFEGLFATKFNRDTWYATIVPLVNFNGDFEEIELNPNTKAEQTDDGDIRSIKIKRANKRERASLYSFHGSTDIRELPRSLDWEYIIRIEGRGIWPESLFSEHVDMIESALRVFGVEKPNFQMGPRYDVIKGNLHDNKDLLDVMGMMPPQYKISYSTEVYTLNKGESDDFIIHWDRYKDYFYTGNNEDLETSISQSLRRFNYMHTRQKSEDKILDWALGLETSLTKDIRGGYSIYLPVRASLLLLDNDRHDSEYIFSYFKKLYKMRNSIIHSGGNVDSIEIDGSKLSPKEVVSEAEYFFAEILIEYAEHDIQGKNITQTNREYLDPLLTEVIQSASSLLKGQ